MSVEQVVREIAVHGGVAHRGQLSVGQGDLRRAVEADLVRRPVRGLYALPTADEALVLARAVRGARSHRSAAMVYGWPMVVRPGRPELVVSRGRASRVPAWVRARADIRWRVLSAAEVRLACIGQVDTVVDCLRDLPVDEGVPLADSALRSGRVRVEEVARALAADRRQGVRAARSLLASVSPLAASVLETRLRMLGEEVETVSLVPQVLIRGVGWTARVDLADPYLGIVAEADSFAWHGDRSALRRDCLRYNRLTCAGWRVLRFSYESVFGEPDVVRQELHAIATQQMRAVAAGLTPWERSLRPQVGEDAA